MRLSPHFHSREFRSSDGAPTPTAYLAELRDLCRDFLEPLRRVYGPVTVHSGHRSARSNAAAHGAPRSRHLDLPGQEGAAADFTCQRGAPADWYGLLDRLGAGGLGLYVDHVHVDNRRGRARW